MCSRKSIEKNTMNKFSQKNEFHKESKNIENNKNNNCKTLNVVMYDF